MPRDIPVGNGHLLVAFDSQYRIRDLYFPHVGQENHAGHGPCRFGVWWEKPPAGPEANGQRAGQLAWTDEGWKIELNYLPNTMATHVALSHEAAELQLHCCDVVDFRRPLFVRRIEVTNLANLPRQVRLFHHQQFHMYGNAIGDTAYYDPQTHSLIHYRGKRYLMALWHAQGEPRIDQYATGASGFNGAEGTWRDAEDGQLGNNPIAQGAVDSTIMLQLDLEPGAAQSVYLILGAGESYEELEELHRFLAQETPEGLIDRTVAYWRLWLNANRSLPLPDSPAAPPQPLVDLFQRSLLLLRSQIDNSGAIIAANDSDYMQYSRDTYSYLWPRDGALVAAALDLAGFPDASRSFYSFCARIITEDGYFLHKYNPDGSPASSWHPWVSEGQPQLPIQEDETALVLWALWRHYLRYRDIEFVRPLWVNLITPAADFMVRFRDPDTRLPLPSYDLWEERWGVHAFTVASAYAGLAAAWQFAEAFGDRRRAKTYANAAQELRGAFTHYFWSAEHERFLRRLVPRDRTALAQFMAGLRDRRNGVIAQLDRQFQAPRLVDGQYVPPGEDRDQRFEVDATIDSSLSGIWRLGLLPAPDPRVEQTMQAIRDRLQVRTPVGGIARYEDDSYHRTSNNVEKIPGNPWIICTLWMAQWSIARARTIQELSQTLETLDWVAQRSLRSGVLAEQVHPLTNAPLSVSPLTWSHAEVVSTFMMYLHKLERLESGPGTPRSRDVSGLPVIDPTESDPLVLMLDPQ